MTVITEPDLSAGDVLPTDLDEPRLRSPAELSRRRFVVASIVGTAIVLPLFLWLQWDLWSGSLNVLRGVPYDYFYDKQARALFHGHLYLPPGTMGIEAFRHDGHDFTYFGLFPSLIRMPILLVTSRLDGDMTAPSILLAWITTAVFSSLMLWRLRVLMRGDALVGRAEAAAYGVLMATILGGSVILYLAATPFVYNEDFAWSIPLTVGSLFALLGVLERPTRGRVIASGVLILCTNLNRTPPGWACSIAAIVIAGWFALGREGTSNRRWALPMVAVGAVPFLVGCVVTYAKFGIPIGLPMADQFWAKVNAHRRYFLAANGGKAFSFAFLPSTLSAYFQPFGMRIGTIFPFFNPPANPAPWLGGAVMDQSYPTASFTDTSPLLLILGVWGAVTAFRPKGVGQVRLTRIILFGGAAGAGGVLLWGYMSQRYIGDLMPFFIIAAGIGLIDVWRRLENRQLRVKGLVLGALGTVGVYCIAVNLAISAFPVSQWTQTQTAGYVSVAKTLSIGSLADSVQRGSTLPYRGPAGQLFDVNNCSGLYLATGNDLRDVPGQNIEHSSWLPVEQSPSYTHILGFTFNRPPSELTHPVTLMTYGKSRLVLEPARGYPGHRFMQVQLYNSGTSIKWPPGSSWAFPITQKEVSLHEQLQTIVTVDPNLHSFLVNWYGDSIMINHYVGGDGPLVVHTSKQTSGSPTPVVSVADVPVRSHLDQYVQQLAAAKPAPLSLCRSLTQGH
jgi:hypothetical protein